MADRALRRLTRFGRRFGAECLGLVLVAALLLAATAGDREAGFQSDDGAYLVLAEAYALPEAQRLPVHDDVIRDTHFPPGWPMVLGALGATPDALEHASRITVASLLLALIAVYGWGRAESGSRAAAIAAALVTGLMPATLLFVQTVFSEFLFMAMVFAAFAALAAAESSSGRPRASWWLLAAALVALASLTRSVGTVLIIAFVISALMRRPPRWPLAALIAALPWLAWNLAHAAIAGKTGYLGDGERGLSVLLGAGLDHWWSVLVDMGRFWVQDLVGPDGRGLPTVWAAPLVAALSVPILPLWWRRFRDGRCDAWYLIGSLTLILIWPYTGSYYVPRFLYPLIPLQLVYLGIALRGRRWPSAGAALLVATLVLPATVPMLLRAYSAVPDDLQGYQRNPNFLAVADRDAAMTYTRFYRDITQALLSAALDVPATQCVHAPQSALVMLHMRRIARPTPKPALIDSLRGASHRLSEVGGCRWVLAVNSSTPAVPSMYPAEPLSRMPAYEVQIFRAGAEDGDRVVAALFRERPR